MKYSIELNAEVCQLLAEKNLYFTQGNAKLPPARNKLIFDESAEFGHFAKILAGNQFMNIGSYSYTWSPLPTDTKIGNYCSIAAQVVKRGLEHPYQRFTTSAITYEKGYPPDSQMKQCGIPKKHSSITIEDDVWIGAYAMLKPGITLHTGCIVAARANVTKDVPPYAIVGGNPARVLKMRFPDEIIKLLLQSRWYDYDITKLAFPSDIEIEAFVELVNQHKENLPRLSSHKLMDVLTELNIPAQK